MLETERAGAKALVVYMDSFERNSEEWKLLRAIHADEAHNCALIGKLLDKARIAHSHATGEFYDKAVALKGRRERIAFLARGLRWAIKRFDEALPKLDGESAEIIRGMRERHLKSAAVCESLARSLSG